MRKSRTAMGFGLTSIALLALSLMSSGPARAETLDANQASLAASDKPVPPPIAPGPAPDAGKRAPSLSSGSMAALNSIQSRIARYVADHGTAYTFGSYLDSTTGRIVIETDAPDQVVTSLISLPAAPRLQQEAARQTKVIRTTVTDSSHRRDDTTPFWGGAGIASGGGVCSAGYTVSNSAGTRFMTTAGHCFANGATVNTESGNNTFGTVSNRNLPSVTGGSTDIELVGGSSYSGRIYTGGVTSTSSLPVVSAGSASVGYADYCHSGRTTGENCGHTATSLTAQVCTSTGCKSPVISFTGGTLSAGGDSGSPFYAKNSTGAYIRGNVIAGSSTTGYATPWTVVSSLLGVSIVTG